MEVNLTRRGMLFRIIRLVTSKLIMGNYHYPNVSEISAEELRARLDSQNPPLLIDTRSTEEFSSGFGHIPLMEIVGTFRNTAAFKAAVKELEGQLAEMDAYKEQEVVTICPGGGFSLVAAEIMADAGFKDVKSLAAGADGWFKKGLPTTLAE